MRKRLTHIWSGILLPAGLHGSDEQSGNSGLDIGEELATVQVPPGPFLRMIGSETPEKSLDGRNRSATRLPQLSHERVVRALKKAGLAILREEGYFSTDGSRILIIPRHHTIKQGTLRQILLF